MLPTQYRSKSKCSQLAPNGTASCVNRALSIFQAGRDLRDYKLSAAGRAGGRRGWGGCNARGMCSSRRVKRRPTAQQSAARLGGPHAGPDAGVECMYSWLTPIVMLPVERAHRRRGWPGPSVRPSVRRWTRDGGSVAAFDHQRSASGAAGPGSRGSGSSLCPSSSSGSDCRLTDGSQSDTSPAPRCLFFTPARIIRRVRLIQSKKAKKKHYKLYLCVVMPRHALCFPICIACFERTRLLWFGLHSMVSRVSLSNMKDER